MAIKIDSTLEAMASCAEFDHTGSRLALTCSDQQVRLYSYNDSTLSEICTMESHLGEVLSLSWSHPKFGSLLASSGSDRKLLIWREQSLRIWQIAYEYSDTVPINCIQFSPWELGLNLLAGLDDGSIILLSYKSEWQSYKFQGHNTPIKVITWGTAISLVAACNKSIEKMFRFVSGTNDGKIKYWNLEDGTYKSENLEKHSGIIRGIAWNPVISSNKEIFASCADKLVVVWYRNTEESGWKAKDVLTFPAPVWKISWNSLGSALAVSAADNITTIIKEDLEENWKKSIEILQKGEIVKLES